MKKGQQSIIIISTVIIIVLVLGITGWHYNKNSKVNNKNGVLNENTSENIQAVETTKKALENLSERAVSYQKQSGLIEVQKSLEEYFNKNKVYPVLLKELSKNNTEIGGLIEKWNFLYSHTNDHKNYHIGITFDSGELDSLKNDFDFNSKIAGYINGFNGEDPIYDLASDKNIGKGEMLESQRAKLGDKPSVTRAQELTAIEIGLEEYSDANGGLYPKKLIDAVDYLKSFEMEIKSDLYFYACSDSQKEFHLGVKLDPVIANFLNSDSDFNSIKAGFKNGFDGNDPIYDKHISE